MLIKFRIILILSTVVCLYSLMGCRSSTDYSFAIYLLSDELSGVDILGKDVGELIPIGDPVISDQYIQSYDSATHTIELTPAGYQRIQALYSLPVRVDGMPFVVYAGGAPIYAGAFWTPLSSLSYGGVVIMQPMDPQGTAIRIDLGYPGQDFFDRTDPRNDPRIMAALRASGKLK